VDGPVNGADGQVDVDAKRGLIGTGAISRECRPWLGLARVREDGACLARSITRWVPVARPVGGSVCVLRSEQRSVVVHDFLHARSSNRGKTTRRGGSEFFW